MPDTLLRPSLLKLSAVCLFMLLLSVLPAGPLTASESAQYCYWAIYEEYFDSQGNQCGVYNSCTGERSLCPNGYAYRTQEIFQCCR